MNKKFKGIPNNSVRVITNLNGKYDVKDYDLESLANDPYPMISLPITEDMVSEDTNIISIDKKVPFEPFIPYAMTTEPGDRFMERTELGIVNIGDKRYVAEWSFEDDKIRPLTCPAIVGDEVGPVGMFVPFNASKEALGGCADLFTELYNNYKDQNSTMKGIVSYTHDPNNYKKLPF